MGRRHGGQELSLAGRFANRTVIVGAGDQGRRLAGYLQRHGDANIRLVGFVDDRATRVAQTNEGLPLLGTVSDLIGLIRRDQVDQVIVALPWTADARLRDIVGRRSEEHTSELQSLMRISYAVFCLK